MEPLAPGSGLVLNPQKCATAKQHQVDKINHQVTYCVPNNSGNSTVSNSFIIHKIVRAIEIVL